MVTETLTSVCSFHVQKLLATFERVCIPSRIRHVPVGLLSLHIFRGGCKEELICRYHLVRVPSYVHLPGSTWVAPVRRHLRHPCSSVRALRGWKWHSGSQDHPRWFHHSQVSRSMDSANQVHWTGELKRNMVVVVSGNFLHRFPIIRSRCP